MRSSLLVLLITTLNLKILAQSDPALRLPDDNSAIVQLEVSGLSNHQLTNDLAYEYLAVFVKNEGQEYLKNPIQGRYQVEGDFLAFTPYFSFAKGMSYVVRVKNHQSESGYIYRDFQVGEKPIVENARLLSIYPSADELPENLLRFYFYFNTPMKRDQAIQHIHLMDTEGNVDDQAFMAFKQELWSPDGKRLTLLFDPGRIKRGVSTNMALGPALLEGNQYSLTISGGWQDVYGQKLITSTTKDFEAGVAYRTAINVKNFRIDTPEAASTQPLTLRFDRIMDHALVQSMILIKDENDRIITGNWEMSYDEKNAHFTPTKQWKTGEYQIIFDGRLEDVAGNNFEGLLDQKFGRSDYNSPVMVRNFSI